MGPETPYDEGYKAADACYSGKLGHIPENPHPKDSSESQEWYRGYLDAGSDWDKRSA